MSEMIQVGPRDTGRPECVDTILTLYYRFCITDLVTDALY